MPGSIMRQGKGLDAEERGMAAKPKVQFRRVYEDTKHDDGARVLVDRIWPRGVSKDKADLDEWCKDIAPSTELRKWYSHDPEKFDEFARRYRRELQEPERAAALDHLKTMAQDGNLTLLTATKDVGISEAAVLVVVLGG